MVTQEEKSRGCCMACLGKARSDIKDEVENGPKPTKYVSVPKDPSKSNQKFKNEKCKECGKQATTQIKVGGNEIFYFCGVHMPVCQICKNTGIIGIKVKGSYRYYCEFHKDKPQKTIDETMIANAKLKSYNMKVKNQQRKEKNISFKTYGPLSNNNTIIICCSYCVHQQCTILIILLIVFCFFVYFV